MKILVACEESQRVCLAFRAKGHEAYSCDIIMCSGSHPEFHILADVTPLLNGCCRFRTCDGVLHYVDKWDMIIAFPPCTYLSKAGASNLFNADGTIKNYDRYELGCLAAAFFQRIWACSAPRVVIENPTPLKIFDLPEPTQIIQPYYFGVPVSKRTCLWLRGLPLLSPTKVVEPTFTFSNYPQFTNCNGKYRARARSRTFLEVAQAMALSWGDLAD